MKINANTKLLKENQNLKILGVSYNDDNNSNAYVALKYFDKNFECLSEWNKSELSSLSNFIEKINNMTWNQIYMTSGKKNGLNYTVHKNTDVLPDKNLKNKLSNDINFFELRVSDKARVHGFRTGSTFFLCWLDRNHRIYPQ